MVNKNHTKKGLNQMASTDAPSPSATSALKDSKFSRQRFVLFIVIFALIGGYIIFKSFAASPLVASLQGEQMALPASGSVFSDSSASGGKAVKITANGTATGSVNLVSPVTSLALVAKGAQCSGAPNATVALDGQTILANKPVSSSSWNNYGVTLKSAVSAGTHKLAVSFTNDYTSYSSTGRGGYKRFQTCSRDLYVDVTNFYGQVAAPTPAPTISLSASPSSVTAGQTSTITWNSTNATSCNASGAWSGSEPTSGSLSTGALNQNSTYSLTCTGSGGSSAASASVTVTNTTPPPTTGSACTKILAATDDILTAYNAAHAGDVVCLHESTVYNVGQIDFRNAIGSANGAITITSQDRSRPSTILGRIVTHPPANYITLSYLILDGKHPSAASDITIGSDYISLVHNNITDENTGICINTIDDSTYGTAHYTLIDQNRIYNCGELPSTNQDHGIYDVGYYSTITNNYIYDNVDRGIQLRQDHNATVKYNTVNNNGEGILVGDSNLAAVNDEIAYNVSSNSNIRYNIEESWSPNPPSNPNNRIYNNCVWTTRSEYNENGGVPSSFSGAVVASNKVANPNYVNSAAKDFTLQTGSGCAGYGVQSGMKPGIN